MNETLLRELRSRLGDDAVREGDQALSYSPAGRPPLVALFPPTREAFGEALALLDAAGAKVLPWGGGTAMLPMERAPDVTLVTRQLNRLVDYQPDDLTVAVEAGMTLGALEAILAQRGQFLPIDPARPERATVGGVVATNRTGPWRCAYRTPRDWVIGMTVLGPDGRVIRGGGRVVKNVAGYDLPRLYTGSRGTLGVIVEVSFKVMPRPATGALAAVRLAGPERAEAAVARIMDSDLMPSCLELLNARAWSELTDAPLVPDPAYVLVAGFEGAAAAVTWQKHALHELLTGIGSVHAVPDARREVLWRELREFPARPAFLVASIHLLSSDLAEIAALCEREAETRQLSVSLAGHAANGVLRLRLHSPNRDPLRAAAFVERVRAAATERGGSLVVTGGAPEVAGRVDLWGPPGPDFRLMRGIKEALDPRGTFYAGAFLGGL